MSSNTNTNADFTHDDHPPTVNVVTQASQLTQEFDLVSTPAQRRNRNDLRDEFNDLQDEYILEHMNTESMPMMEPLTEPDYPTQTNQLPDTSKCTRIIISSTHYFSQACCWRM